ncbi:hypothetical protein CORC01_13577 [Colletotrichum orchidophilum]|uniref:Uncharacterized protein n=1 Tax=Colletotrichum orchidophilum TaxID=1209926 RepID=A0A1G4APM0_9PEZI|nr:uncharacterized protein CORC01_13577 [Colletotrichum orchidophilum]OHE91130.1 hypothetical protein CORC01_13577 [Colletotrichum orchidophilum]
MRMLSLLFPQSHSIIIIIIIISIIVCLFRSNTATMISQLINSPQGMEASALSDLAILPPPKPRPVPPSVNRLLAASHATPSS